MGLERGPLSLVWIIQELLERKGGVSGLENRDERPCGPVALSTRYILPAIVSTKFAEKRGSIGQYSSLAN
jgi:hypothetical protein